MFEPEILLKASEQLLKAKENTSCSKILNIIANQESSSPVLRKINSKEP